MSDIVERMRKTRADMIGTEDEDHYFDCHDAANEIERLRAENERMRDALEKIVSIQCDKYSDDFAEIEEAQKIARAVLSPPNGSNNRPAK